ncbi:MAG: ADYC domain-containing protein, partial [Polyangia bacterium]
MRPASYLAFTLVAAAATPARAGLGYNGVQMNGVQMNGVQMNGVQMNGVQMNGVQMNGIPLTGVVVNGLRLEGTRLKGTFADSVSWCSHSQLATGAPLPFCSPCAAVVEVVDPHCAFSAWDQTCVDEATAWCAVDADQLVGATFTANTNGPARTLKLAKKPVLAADPVPVWRQHDDGTWYDANADVWLYSFVYWQPDKHPWSGTWNPICANATNAAIPVAGQWATCEGTRGACGGKTSDVGFSLGCDGIGAIAKCLNQFQYKPWKYVAESAPLGTPTHFQTLETFHEACVRMVRGDYCGDGVPHTVDGTQIDVYDHMGVQKQTPLLPINFHFEAGWTPHGAACISVTRYQTFGGNPKPQPGVPAYPDAIANCTEISPVQWVPNGQIYIIEGCGNFY